MSPIEYDFTDKIKNGLKVLGDISTLKVFEVKTLEDVDKMEGIYDVVICNILHTLKRPTETIKKIHTFLGEGGRLYMDTPLLETIGGNTIGGKDWNNKKTGTWLDKHYVRDGNVFKKTDFRFLLVYKYHPHNTGAFIEKAMRKIVKVVNAEHIGVKSNGEGIKSICEKLDITHLLYIDSAMRIILPKGLKCTTMAYSIDTFMHTDMQYRYLKQFDICFFAQKRFVKDINHYFLPLAVDTDIYRPLRTRKRYDISFCGTLLLDELHKDRNNLLKMLANNTNFYWGKDSNEWANLRYNEAHFVFNYGIASDLNMRVFEAMASGVPLLMNNVDNLDDYFIDGVDYIKYNVDNLKEQFEKYANNPDKLIEIGESAMKKIREKHTYSHRVNEILKIILDKKDK